MRFKSFNRWQAAGIHLLICLVIASTAIGVIVGVWFPGPLFEAAGGMGLLYLLIGVDVTVGPLLTFVVFKSGKKGLKLDLAVIGALQLAALIYGCSVVFLARPAFIVFVKDRFELVTVVELDAADLAKARYPEFRSFPWTGPRLAAADLPTDPVGQQKFVMLAAAGIDVQSFPEYYVPYAQRVPLVLKTAMSIEKLRADEPLTARAVDAWLAASGTREADVRAHLLRTRFAWVAVLIDPKTAQPVKMLLGEKIGEAN
jgi:hypothetical protein